MNLDEATQVVFEINAVLKTKPWFDFEVMEYVGYNLVVMGGIDTSAPHSLEIKFKDVFFVSLPMCWGTDTSIAPLTIVTREAALEINEKFRVEQGNHIFSFRPEDYPFGFGCLIGSKGISFTKV
jgi:hypothetical protein